MERRKNKKMKVKILYGGSSVPIEANEENVSTFWEDIAKKLFEMDFPESGLICIETENPGQTAEIAVEVEENGKIAFSPARSNIFMKYTLFGVKKLRMIDAETGAHVFYDIVPNNMGDVTCNIGARYGQTGGTTVGADLVEGAYVLRSPYQPWFYWIKYYDLLRRGYVDYTDDIYDADEEESKFRAMFDDDAVPAAEEEVVLAVYEFLQARAKEYLSEQMNVEWLSNKPPFNRRQIASSWKAWGKFSGCFTAKEANKVVEKLLAITDVSFKEGKSKKTVKDFMVKEHKDPKEQAQAIADAADQWYSIILAMEAVLPPPAEVGKEKKKIVSPFGNITMEPANKEETQKILKKFRAPKDYSYRYVKVDAPDFRERQDKYCEAKGITEDQMELFIHGSRVQNWTSIIRNGLLLNPDAIITGKAYGNGIYTARDFIKSLGYTSFFGSKWAGGDQNIGVIGVYRTAYGKPLIDGSVHGNACEAAVKKGGYNCLDAKAGISSFRMDEIVFYEEEALCLEGLIFFAEKDDEDALDMITPAPAA